MFGSLCISVSIEHIIFVISKFALIHLSAISPDWNHLTNSLNPNTAASTSVLHCQRDTHRQRDPHRLRVEVTPRFRRRSHRFALTRRRRTLFVWNRYVYFVFVHILVKMFILFGVYGIWGLDFKIGFRILGLENFRFETVLGIDNFRFRILGFFTFQNWGSKHLCSKISDSLFRFHY